MSALAATTEWRAPKPDPRRWYALVFIAMAQLMIALDATIVSIALPSAQSTLGASDADRQWVVTAYTLSFGGLLLLGGRVADVVGRKRALLVGLGGFAVASMLGGAAPSFEVLVAARALQGAFAALLAPTALSLLAVAFTEPRERATAFAVYGSIAGTGAALGFLAGGALTQYFSWRWCLYVNVPVAVAAGVGGLAFVPGAAGPRDGRFDLGGALLATGGFASLVYASSEVARLGWTSPAVVTFLAIGALALAGFAAWESRVARPLLPLNILADRDRAGAYLAVGLGVAGMFGAYLCVTYYLQVVMRYTPLEAGLAFLPMTVASQAGSWLIARRLVPRIPPRTLMVPASLVAAMGIALLSQLHVGGAYLAVVVAAEVMLGAGISSTMVPAFSTATRHVDPRQAGVASAMVNAAQQIGASLGTAALNGVAAASAASFSGPRSLAVLHGFTAAAGWGATLMIGAAVAAGLLITAGRPGRG